MNYFNQCGTFCNCGLHNFFVSIIYKTFAGAVFFFKKEINKPENVKKSESRTRSVTGASLAAFSDLAAELKTDAKEQPWLLQTVCSVRGS